MDKSELALKQGFGAFFVAAAKNREGGHMFSNFAVGIISGLITHCIIKWLDGHGKGDK